MAEPMADDREEAAPAPAAASSDEAVAEGGGKGAEGAPRKKRDDKPPPKAERPDREAYEASRAGFDATVAECKAEMDRLTAEIQQKQNQQKQVVEKRASALRAVDQCRQRRNTLLDEEDIFRDQMEAIEKTRESQREYLDSLKKGLKFTKVEDLDNATAKIINKLSGAGVTIETQGKLARDLQDLRAQRVRVVHYQDQLNTIIKGVSGVSSIRDLLAARGKEAKDVKAEEEAARKSAKELQAQETKLRNDVDGLYKSKKKANDKKKVNSDKAWALQKEFQKQERAYERYSEYVKYVKRKEAREERAKRRAAEEAAWKAEQNGEVVQEDSDDDSPGEPKKPPNPHQKDINVLEELQTYLTNLLPRKDTEEGEAEDKAQGSKPSVADRNAAFKGEKLMAVGSSTKNDSDDDEKESYLALMKTKKTRAKKRKVKDPSTVSVSHIPDIFDKFAKVKVTTPLFQSQLADALSSVEKKLEKLLAWEPKKAPEPGSEPPAEVLKEEAKAQQGARRASVAAANAEQARRVAEQEDVHAMAAEDEASARRASVQLATSWADEEQHRRVVEQEQATLAAEEEAAQERAANIAHVTKLAEAERVRRVSLTADLDGEEAMLRAEATTAAQEAADAEKARRVAEANVNPEEEPVESRKISQDAAAALVEEERAARVAEAPPSTEGKKKSKKKSNKKKKKKSKRVDDDAPAATAAPAAAAPTAESAADEAAPSGDLSEGLAKAEAARVAAGGSYTESSVTKA